MHSVGFRLSHRGQDQGVCQSSVLWGALGISSIKPPRNATQGMDTLLDPNPKGVEPARQSKREHTYWKEGRTRKPISFLSQESRSVGAASSRGDASSHTSWMSWQSGSQKGSVNSKKILLLVPKPIFLMASAFSAGSGGSKNVSRCSLRKPGIHNWTRLTPLKSLK